MKQVFILFSFIISLGFTSVFAQEQPKKSKTLSNDDFGVSQPIAKPTTSSPTTPESITDKLPKSEVGAGKSGVIKELLSRAANSRLVTEVKGDSGCFSTENPSAEVSKVQIRRVTDKKSEEIVAVEIKTECPIILDKGVNDIVVFFNYEQAQKLSELMKSFPENFNGYVTDVNGVILQISKVNLTQEKKGILIRITSDLFYYGSIPPATVDFGNGSADCKITFAQLSTLQKVLASVLTNKTQ